MQGMAGRAEEQQMCAGGRRRGASGVPGVLRSALLAGAAAALLFGAPARAQSPDPAPAGPPPMGGPDVKAASAILVDAATGTVLWEKSSGVRRPVASTTKIMTATLLLESGRLDEWVKFSERARHTAYANLNAKPGEQLPMRDLLYAILLRSSNDGCVAAAEHVAGSEAAFARAMTERARALGCFDTRFITSNGLYHPAHFSTAADLARMTRHAIRNPVFNEVVATRTYTLTRSLNAKDLLVRNHNKFLSKYQGADGVKTGYVRQSGRCLVASATRYEGGRPWRLIAVVLNSGDTYGDSSRLMDWGRKFYEPVFFAHRGEQVGTVQVRAGSHPRVPLRAAGDLMAIVRRQAGNNTQREVRVRQGLPAPIEQDQVCGRLVALVDGKPIAEVDLVAAETVGQVWHAGLAPWSGWSMGLAAVLLGPRYARTVAKSARRRRRRLQARRGGADRRGEGCG